jgi:hypothetical protein
MAKGRPYKMFIYFLCFSFLLLTAGFPKMSAEAREGGLPIGEMISRGEVTFEARENTWKRVEPSFFPIFQGTRIKTEKGMALIALTNESQIEVGQNSLFSFQQNEQFHIFQGRVSFRLPAGVDMNFRVGNVSIGKSPPMEAAKNPVSSPGSQETVGSIVLRSNGAVTVKSIQGPLSIQNQDRVVVAAISPKESVTIPSVVVSGGQRQVVAQVGEYGQYPTGEAITEELLGLSYWTWMFIGLGAVVAVGAGITYAATKDGDDDDFILPIVPVCP